MKIESKQMRLYAVTDRAWAADEDDFLAQVEAAIDGGATIVQLREKHLDHVEYVGFLVSCANLLEKQAKVCYAENTTNCTRRRAKFMEKRYDDEKQMVQTHFDRCAVGSNVLWNAGSLWG